MKKKLLSGLLLSTILFGCKKEHQPITTTYICGIGTIGLWGNQNGGYWHPAKISFVNKNISRYEICNKTSGLLITNIGDTLYKIKYNDIMTFNCYINNTDTMWITINNDTINKQKCIDEGYIGIKQK